jgi:hypothetical protein
MVRPMANDDFDKDGVNQYPETEFVPVPTKELDKQAKQQMKEFGELLNSLDKSLDKKKQLWKQIYENAVVDRKNAYLVWADLYVAVHARPAEHAIHGQTLSKYMERMSKATDQLLKLAELVANAEANSPKEIEERMSDDDIYNSIQSSKKH